MRMTWQARLAGLRGLLVLMGGTAAVMALVNRFVLAVYIVEGSSMAPTLKDGDTAIVNMLSWASGGWNRGEIVLVSDGSGGFATKRIIGLPGERIDIRDNRVYVDGRPLNESYLPKATETVSSCPSFPLGAADYFVLGDNRADSFDSRSYGPISGKRIVGSYTRSFWGFR